MANYTIMAEDKIEAQLQVRFVTKQEQLVSIQFVYRRGGMLAEYYAVILPFFADMLYQTVLTLFRVAISPRT